MQRVKEHAYGWPVDLMGAKGCQGPAKRSRSHQFGAIGLVGVGRYMLTHFAHTLLSLSRIWVYVLFFFSNYVKNQGVERVNGHAHDWLIGLAVGAKGLPRMCKTPNACVGLAKSDRFGCIVAC